MRRLGLDLAMAVAVLFPILLPPVHSEPATEPLNLLHLSNSANITAFGDSLTFGEVTAISNSSENKVVNIHPYTLKMAELMNNNNYTGSIIISARSGEKVDSMHKRIDTALNHETPRVVIILGGTNDFLATSSAYHTLRFLRMLHRKVLLDSKRNLSVAITIPPAAPKLPIQNAKRLGINDGLRQLATKCSRRVALVDLDTVKAIAQYQHLREDEIHFTPSGYDLLGELVFRALLNFAVTPATEGPFNAAEFESWIT